MLTTKEFCKREYGQELYKISFDAGFSCPNRDGLIDTRGCIFCSEGGSGDFAVKLSVEDPDGLEEEIAYAKSKVRGKYKGDKFIAYFQAFSNTYADADRLRRIYMPIIARDDVAVLSIATRPDCLNEEIYALLLELNSIKPVWVELGLQTSKAETALFIRRGYENEVYVSAVKRLNAIGIHTITHLIMYLPGESEEDMINSVSFVTDSSSKGIKLQLLHIIKGTDLALYYEKEPFYIPTLEEYAGLIKKLVDILPDNMVVHRLTGDAPKRLLIEPKWSADKKRVINAINELINPPEPYYVYMIRCEDESYYTGSAKNISERFNKHLSGKGAKYTRSHRPVELIYVERCTSKNKALSREYAIKQLSRKDKKALLGSGDNIVDDFRE